MFPQLAGDRDSSWLCLGHLNFLASASGLIDRKDHLKRTPTFFARHGWRPSFANRGHDFRDLRVMASRLQAAGRRPQRLFLAPQDTLAPIPSTHLT